MNFGLAPEKFYDPSKRAEVLINIFNTDGPAYTTTNRRFEFVPIPTGGLLYSGAQDAPRPLTLMGTTRPTYQALVR